MTTRVGHVTLADLLGGERLVVAAQARRHRERIVAGALRQLHEEAGREVLGIVSRSNASASMVGARRWANKFAPTPMTHEPAEALRLPGRDAEQQLRAEREADGIDLFGGERGFDGSLRGARTASGSCGASALP